MTTPETPGETPEQPQRVPSATDAAPRRGFNFGNKRFIIGGAIGAARCWPSLRQWRSCSCWAAAPPLPAPC